MNTHLQLTNKLTMNNDFKWTLINHMFKALNFKSGLINGMFEAL